MRLLILGASGQIGSALATACHDRRWPHLCTSYRQANPTDTPLDVRDEDAVRQLLAEIEPDVTIYAAPPDGVEHVVRAVAETDGLLVAYTCGSLFGHTRGVKREEDAPNPLSQLNRQHVALEQRLRQWLPERHLILRTHSVFSAAKFGRVNKLLKQLRRDEDIIADDDHLMMPTYAGDLAEATCELLKHGQRGTIHAVGPERQTDFSFARLVAFLFGQPADLIEPRTIADDTRPQRVNLDRSRLRQLLGPNAIRTTAEALRTIRTQMQPVPVFAHAA